MEKLLRAGLDNSAIAWQLTDQLVRGLNQVLVSQPYEAELWIEYMDTRRREAQGETPENRHGPCGHTSHLVCD